MPNSSHPDWLTIADVMSGWRVSRQTVMNWLSAGLPSILLNRKRYMRREDVKSWFGQILTTAPEVKTRRRNRAAKD